MREERCGARRGPFASQVRATRCLRRWGMNARSLTRGLEAIDDLTEEGNAEARSLEGAHHAEDRDEEEPDAHEDLEAHEDLAEEAPDPEQQRVQGPEHHERDEARDAEEQPLQSVPAHELAPSGGDRHERE